MKKRVYSTELKEQAVRLSYQRENIKELADELGIDVQRIYKWRRASKSNSSTKPEKPIAQDTLEVKRLRKALKEKELEIISSGLRYLFVTDTLRSSTSKPYPFKKGINEKIY